MKIYESEEFLRACLDSLTASIAILDQTGRIIFVNRAWVEFGKSNGARSPDGYVGSEYIAACSVSGEDADIAAAFADGIRAVQKGDIRHFSLEYPCHSPREKRWFRGNVSLFFSGGAAYVVTAHENVTERELARQREIYVGSVLRGVRNVDKLIAREDNPAELIQKACETLKNSMSYNSAWIALFDESGTVSTTAQAGIDEFFEPLDRMLRKGLLPYCAKKAMAEKSVVSLAVPSTLCGDCPVDKARPSERAVLSKTLEYRGNTCGVIAVSAPPQYSTGDQERSLFEELADNIGYALHKIKMERQRRAGEKALAESEQRYRLLYESMPQGVIRLDREGKFTDANPAAKRILGFDPAEFSPMAPSGEHSAAVHEDGSPMPLSEHPSMMTLRTGLPVHDVVMGIYNPREKRRHWVKTHAIPRFRNGETTPCSVYCTFEDITERKRAEQERENLEKQLRQARKMEAVGTFAGGIAHDFNNILSSLLGFLELAIEDAGQDARLKYKLEGAFASGLRAKDLVKQILAFARQTEDKPIPLKIKSIAKEALKLLRSVLPADILIRERLQSDSFVLADPTRIHQVLMNLCANAAQAMENDGGVLEISLTDMETCARSSAVPVSPERHVKLVVSDTGPGISPEVAGRIFEPFFTTRQNAGGTGLGLSVVDSIVKNSGWKLSVENAPGKGAAFTVLFPVVENAAPPPSPSPKLLPVGNKRILFIDDDPMLNNVSRQILERLGYSVVTFVSGVEALELFRSKPDDFDLVVTDMTMPAMNGDRLAVEIMKIRPEVPVILCTGFNKKISAETTIKTGIKAVLHKPVTKSEWAKNIRRVLGDTDSK